MPLPAKEVVKLGRRLTEEEVAERHGSARPGSFEAALVERVRSGHVAAFEVDGVVYFVAASALPVDDEEPPA